jgi:hypothetical protein
MAGAYPKPDGQKRHRGPTLEWTPLSPDPGVEAPDLPDWHQWHPGTVEWWRDLWTKPPAQMWDKSGTSVWTLALLTDDMISKRVPVSRVSAERRAHEDRHGLTPKSLLQLRWRVMANVPVAEPVLPADEASSEARRRRMRVIQDGGAA